MPVGHLMRQLLHSFWAGAGPERNPISGFLSLEGLPCRYTIHKHPSLVLGVVRMPDLTHLGFESLKIGKCCALRVFTSGTGNVSGVVHQKMY
jgi:hypothetical protein